MYSPAIPFPFSVGTVVSRSKRRSRSPRYDLSDISSDELSSEEMGGDTEEEEVRLVGGV